MPDPKKSVDAYLARLDPAQRAVLAKLRATIRAAAPGAVEEMSYGIPTFRLGVPLIGYGASKAHCALYLMSATTVGEHARELAGRDTSKGTVRFEPDAPLPATLVKKLVRARIAENERIAAGKAPTKKVATKRTTETAAKATRRATPAKSAAAKPALTPKTTSRAAKAASAAPRATSARGESSSPRAASRDVEALLDRLRRASTQHDRDNLARFGITAPRAFGVSMANLKPIAKSIGRDHALAAALWETGWYEARMLATLVDEPALVTPAQMDRWSNDFDNWGICDTACFALFDRTPHAFAKVAEWKDRRDEHPKRAAFALLASLALHDKKSGDEPFLACLPFVERAAVDERNFVKKGVNWALRAVGRRNPRLNAAASAVARRLAASDSASARWVGKDALREFEKVAARRAAKKTAAD